MTAKPAFAGLSRAFAPIIPALFAVLGACAGEEAVDVPGPASHEEFARQLESNGLGKTLMGRRWLEAAREALTRPLEIVPPYAESGGFLAHRAAALGVIFEAFEGQTLRLDFTQRDPAGRVYVELFLVREPLEEARHVRLRGLQDGASALEMVLPHDGRYIVRLQPELLVDALYDLRLELDAAFPFPVQIESNAVGSFFGDPRDAGARSHEGIDIFAPRNTPVTAVADGRANARTTPRGGNVVWLRADGRSYYYAHLEKAAFSGTQTVRAGDVLGYVGNSGNAITTPTHLHFGVYRRGRGATDPLPRLASRVFDDPPQPVEFAPRYVQTHAGLLNLRAAPDRGGELLAQLEAGSVLRSSAIRGDWLRVTTPTGLSGWIHADYQEDAAPVGHWRPGAAVSLLDSLVGTARPVARVAAGEELEVLGAYAPHLLVRRPEDGTAGWIAGPLLPPELREPVRTGPLQTAQEGASAGAEALE